jgi:hypothetical protein
MIAEVVNSLDSPFETHRVEQRMLRLYSPQPPAPNRARQQAGPASYLITFVCYGTRLHGDEGAIDRNHNLPGGRTLPLGAPRKYPVSMDWGASLECGSLRCRRPRRPNGGLLPHVVTHSLAARGSVLEA